MQVEALERHALALVTGMVAHGYDIARVSSLPADMRAEYDTNLIK